MTVELRNQSDHEFVDISTELKRTYIFPNGEMVEIEHPEWLSVSASGGHRVLDVTHTSHYIPPRWIHLFWRVYEGAPNFVK